MACKGIDVSKYQGAIDWQRVAAEGIKFAFVRIGWAGYEGGIDEGADPHFDANMKGALAAGLAVGAYVYSYCRSANAARRAAREAAERCRPYRLTMPLALDIEDAATYKGIARGDSSIIAAAFLDEAAAQGYCPLLYTYTSFANSYLDMGALSDYDLWLADYRGYMGIKGASIWQYSSFGAVEGIAGRVDMNIAYKDYPALIGGTQKEEKDGMMEFYEVFGGKNCQCFTAPDVNAVDTGYNGGTLKSGSFYPVMADAGAGADGYHWYRVYAGGATRYAVLLADRSRITALSAGDAVKAVAAQTGAAGGDAAALAQQVEQLAARAADAEKKAAEAEQREADAVRAAGEAALRADGYLARITAAQTALAG